MKLIRCNVRLDGKQISETVAGSQMDLLNQTNQRAVMALFYNSALINFP